MTADGELEREASKRPKARRAKSAASPQAPPKPEPWRFTRRIRPNSFGWRTPPAVAAVKAAVSEIKRVAKKDPVRAGEGAVMFFERVASAINAVDGSSGSMGVAVNSAVTALADVIAEAPIDVSARSAWLDRLWVALEKDDKPVLEHLAHAWGRMCAGTELARQWGDRCAPEIRRVFSAKSHIGYPSDIAVGLSSLLAARRFQEVVDLVALHRIKFWPDYRYAVLAVAGLGRVDEALAMAEENGDDDLDEYETAAEVSERILLAAGRRDEAYRRFALDSAFARTSSIKLVVQRLATRYPEKSRAELFEAAVNAAPDFEDAWLKALNLPPLPDS